MLQVGILASNSNITCTETQTEHNGDMSLGSHVNADPVLVLRLIPNNITTKQQFVVAAVVVVVVVGLGVAALTPHAVVANALNMLGAVVVALLGVVSALSNMAVVLAVVGIAAVVVCGCHVGCGCGKV